MNFRIVTDSKKWDQFVASEPYSQFLQSWSWGEFQKAYGRRVWRVGMFERCHPEQSEGSLAASDKGFFAGAQNDKLVGTAQIIEHYLGLGMGYLYCPRGSVFSLSSRAERGIPNNNESGIMNYELRIKELIEFLKKEIINYGTLFFRVEPNSEFRIQSSEFGIQRVPSIQPSHTLMLDLAKSEDELLNGMHQKTRYNIRLAERKGLEFENVILNGAKRSEESFSHFWSLLREVAKRDKIRLHPKKYYEIMLRNVTCYMLYVSCFKNLLAAGLFIGFGNTFSYVHGASSNQHREMMAPHLLYWQAIKFAKNRGYRYYDFGGVNPEDKNDFDYRPSWEGMTRFKRGFGGIVHSYAGTYDFPFHLRWYRIYQLVKKIRKIFPL